MGTLRVRGGKPNVRSYTGYHPSIKTGAMVWFESRLEQDLLYRLDVDPDVVWFESQPLQISFGGTFGKVRHYTPDLCVQYDFGGGRCERVLYEVKLLEDLFDQWIDLKPGFAAAGEMGLTSSTSFVILTEYEIRTEELANAKFLWTYLRRKPDTESDARLLHAMPRVGQITISALFARLDCASSQGMSVVMTSLFQLIARRAIHVDLTKPITHESAIWRATLA